MVGKFHRHGAGQHRAALHRLDQLRHVAVTRIEIGIGVGDADDRTIERVIGIAHRLDEGLAQEQREILVAVTGQAFAHSAGHSTHSIVSRSSPRRRDPETRTGFPRSQE